ncbi:MAG: SUMF1/EgtB/PvdO family nonheme iron enzyme, partial [Nitrospirales bacterium]
MLHANTMAQRVTSQVAPVLLACIGASALLASAAERMLSETDLEAHLDGIAALAKAAPVVVIPEGPFLMGTNRIDDDPYGLATQFDNTELPQREVWLDAYAMDRYEASLAEYLAFLKRQGRESPQ